MKSETFSKFKNPTNEFGMQPIVHVWPENYQDMVDALKDYGCRGAVLNCPLDNGFTSNQDNLHKLSKILDAMDKAGLKYWIYDEKGYPSGFCDGQTLDGHPELESMGFYMRRFIAYEPRHLDYVLDCESEKIVWAAKYRLQEMRIDESRPDFGTMSPLPFSKTECHFDMAPNEIVYVFCVKRAYYGSHLTHNVCSKAHYLNMLEPAAVRRFLDVAYEPIAKAIPDAYSRAEAVFTDEPSLQTMYIRQYESWSHALAAWKEGLFEDYEAEYGESLLPKLPLIFEGCEEAYPVRLRFYRLIGKLLAKSWSGQIQDWCNAHGGVFSGHYLCEEFPHWTVYLYGDLSRVMQSVGYPGIDELLCVIEDYWPHLPKIPQMAMRKMGADGMMVEICPFVNVEEFMKAPLDNMCCVMGDLFIGGVRKVNSYFMPDFSKWRDGRLAGRKGKIDQEQTLYFNRYIGRIGMMLDGLQNECCTFIYFNQEEIQAMALPSITFEINMKDSSVAQTTEQLNNRLYFSGHDCLYADTEDLVKAAQTQGFPRISGHEVKVLVVPTCRIMTAESLTALARMQEAGTQVLFEGKLPELCIGGDIAELTAPFKALSDDDILSCLADCATDFTVDSADGILVHAKYITKDGHDLYLINNRARNVAHVTCRRTKDGVSAKTATLLNPDDGDIREISLEIPFEIPAARAVFLEF